MQPIQGRDLGPLLAGVEEKGRREFLLIGKERHDVGRPGDQGYPIRGILMGPYLYLRNFETARWPAGNPETGYLNCDGSPTKTICLELRRQGGEDRWWRLAFGKRPPEELYHVTEDPACLENLAARREHRTRKAAMAARLRKELQAQGDPRMAGRGEIFDHYPYADKRHRLFHDRFMKGEKLRAGWVDPGDFEKGGRPKKQG